jgi:hypothetical protein
MSISQKSDDSKAWKIDKTLLDDSEYRKTHTKKKEKLEISCELNSDDLVLKSFNFDLDVKNDEENEKFEFGFNNLVRSNFKSEFSQVSEFLSSINLDKYLTLMVENGFDDIKKIMRKEFD